LLESLRRMKIQEQSEVPAVQIEVHQCRLFPWHALLNGCRQVHGYGTGPNTASRSNDTDDSSRLLSSHGRPSVEPLLEPRQGRLDFLAVKRLGKKFLDADSERFQQHVRVRPRRREKHLEIRGGDEQLPDLRERLLRPRFVQIEQNHVGCAGAFPSRNEIVAPPRNDFFEGLPDCLIPTVD
jgi:hypothetical protein